MGWNFSPHPERSSKCDLFKLSPREAEDVGDGLEGDLALHDVQALGQGGVIFTGLLPALVGEGEGVAQRGVGEGEGGGVGYGTRDVGHAIVYDAFLDIHGIAVGGGA